MYEGEWHNNKRHTHGTMYWKDFEEVYKGEWLEGKQVGVSPADITLFNVQSADLLSGDKLLDQSIVCWSGDDTLHTTYTRHFSGLLPHSMARASTSGQSEDQTILR